MSLSEQQNQAVTRILIEFYNNLLVDIMQQLFLQSCQDLTASDQVNALQIGMLHTLKQSANQAFQKTKSALFDFIARGQQAKLTESAFKNIFDKYLLPASLISQYKQQPNDVVLQMGMTLIVGNIKTIFQDSSKCKQLIKLMNKDQLPKDCFIDLLTPIIEKIQQSMHSQLIGEPVKPSIKQTPNKHQKCQKCEKMLKKVDIMQKSLELMEAQNSMLKQMLEEQQSLANNLNSISLRQNEFSSLLPRGQPKGGARQTCLSQQDQSNAHSTSLAHARRSDVLPSKRDVDPKPYQKSRQAVLEQDSDQEDENKRASVKQKSQVQSQQQLGFSRKQYQIESSEEQPSSSSETTESQSEESLELSDNYEEEDEGNIKKIDMSQQNQLTDRVTLLV